MKTENKLIAQDFYFYNNEETQLKGNFQEAYTGEYYTDLIEYSRVIRIFGTEKENLRLRRLRRGWHHRHALRGRGEARVTRGIRGEQDARALGCGGEDGALTARARWPSECRRAREEPRC